MGEFVVRTEFPPDLASLPAPANAGLSLLLYSLDGGPTTRFDVYEAEARARASQGGEVYRFLFEVRGPWTEPPTHAVYAIWEVADVARVEGFLERARQVFALRREVLPKFAYDWLLQSLDHDRRFLVLGLYGDEESATSLCREHPEIQKFVKAHPASQYGAQDMTGLRCFRVERGM